MGWWRRGSVVFTASNARFCFSVFCVSRSWVYLPTPLQRHRAVGEKPAKRAVREEPARRAVGAAMGACEKSLRDIRHGAGPPDSMDGSYPPSLRLIMDVRERDRRGRGGSEAGEPEPEPPTTAACMA